MVSTFFKTPYHHCVTQKTKKSVQLLRESKNCREKMKYYRSVKWWCRAIFFHIKHWFGIRDNKGYYFQRNLWLFTWKHRDSLIISLVSKYPQLEWVKPQVPEGPDAGMSPEIALMTGVKMCSMYTCWTYHADIDTCKKILELNFIFQSQILLKNKHRHSVVVIGIDAEKMEFIVHDPLGDYNLDYKIKYGTCVQYKIKLFLHLYEIDKIFLATSCETTDKVCINSLRRILESLPYYEFFPNEIRLTSD